VKDTVVEKAVINVNTQLPNDNAIKSPNKETPKVTTLITPPHRYGYHLY